MYESREENGYQSIFMFRVHVNEYQNAFNYLVLCFGLLKHFNTLSF